MSGEPKLVGVTPYDKSDVNYNNNNLHNQSSPEQERHISQPPVFMENEKKDGFDNPAYITENPDKFDKSKVDDEEDEAKYKKYGVDENEERGNWDGQLDFLLACLGYAVGLGNVWRFPYLCYSSGGGTFFIPYCICLLFVGVPIFFLELSLGQFCSRGPMSCWKFAPMFTGVGWAMVVVSMLVGLYYNVVIAWSIYYLAISFAGIWTQDLPWKYCNSKLLNQTDRHGKMWYCDGFYPSIPSDLCMAGGTLELITNETTPTTICYAKQSFNDTPDLNNTIPFDMEIYKDNMDVLKFFCQGTISANNGTCQNSLGRIIGFYNTSMSKKNLQITRDSAAQLYWDTEVHETTGRVDGEEGLLWWLVLSLFVAWVIVFFCMIKGVKSTGKVVYFTALFPYVVLIILFIRGMMLDGMEEGIDMYLKPDWDQLKNAKVWNAAANQIFFSLSTCWGGLIALASYNKFHNNCFRDALIVSFGNCLTSFFAGFVIFAYLGHMAHATNQEVKDVASSGPGLAFIVYPTAVTLLPGDWVWALLFFIMLLTLGLDSQFTLLETVLTTICDASSSLRRNKTWVLLGISILLFCAGLSMCTRNGVYVLGLLDAYSGNWNVLLIGIIELFAVSWIYGMRRFSLDIKLMIGFSPGMVWWGICWMFLTPLICAAVLLFAWIDYSPLKDGSYVYPDWANAIGWFTCLISVGGVPVIAIYIILTASGSFIERIKKVTSPTIFWGPDLVKHRKKVDYVPGFVIDPKAESNQYQNTAYISNNNP